MKEIQYSSLIPDSRLYESVWDLGAIAVYPRQPDLASLPVGEPPVQNRRRATRTLSQDSGEYAQIPADRHPWAAQLQPGTPFLSPVPKEPPKVVVGHAPDGSDPNVAAGIRIEHLFVENEPRPIFKPSKDQDRRATGQRNVQDRRATDQWNVQEATVRVPKKPKIRGRAIETLEGRESSSMKIKMAIKLWIEA